MDLRSGELPRTPGTGCQVSEETSSRIYGNIAPTSDLLQVLFPLEALIEFALLTTSLTWAVSIYLPLNKRKSLAQQIALVRGAESETGISVTQVGAEAAERRLEALTSQLVTGRSDLIQLSIILDGQRAR